MKYKYKVIYDPAFDSWLGRLLRAVRLCPSYKCDEMVPSIVGGLIVCLRVGKDEAKSIPAIQIVRVDMAFGANEEVARVKEQLNIGSGLQNPGGLNRPGGTGAKPKNKNGVVDDGGSTGFT